MLKYRYYIASRKSLAIVHKNAFGPFADLLIRTHVRSITRTRDAVTTKCYVNVPAASTVTRLRWRVGGSSGNRV